MSRVVITIERSPNANGIPQVDRFDVPYFDEMDLVDALVYVRDHLDPTLAFRYSCEEGKCGLCGVEVNGLPVLACKRVLQQDEIITLAPLSDFPVIKDLLVDRTGYDQEILSHHRATLAEDEGRAGQQSELNLFLALSDCVECGACSTRCAASLAGVHDQAGPVAFLDSVRAALSGNSVSDLAALDLFDCLECAQCYQICSRDVAIPDLVAQARHTIRPAGQWPKGTSAVVARVASSHALLSRGADQGTSDWLRSADERVAERVGRKGSPVGLFVGCQYGIRPQLASVPNQLALLLLAAEIDFTLLGDVESCCGHPLHAVGDTDGVRQAAERNIEAFRDLGVHTVLMSCPGCYHAWTREYPNALGQSTGMTVIHSSEMLLDLLRAGRLSARQPCSQVVAYHDPCELGRMCGIFEPPRDVLDAIPQLERTRLPRERAQALCCGGGGLVPSTGRVVSQSVSTLRLEEIRRSGAEIIATTCPNCEFTLSSALRRQRNGRGDPLQVMDIVELLYLSILEGDRRM